MKGSLSLDGGRAYELAMILLAPSIAAFTEEEFAELISLVKSTDVNTLQQSFSQVEKMSAVTMTGVLYTRFGGLPAASEASQMLSLAARYLDAGMIMPPLVAKYEKEWWMTFIPEFAEDWFDDLADLYSQIVLTEREDYQMSNPPIIIDGPQSAGFRRELFDVLDYNIPAIRDNTPEAQRGAAAITGAQASAEPGFLEQIIPFKLFK